MTAIRAMTGARLQELVGGRDHSVDFLLHGVVQHNLYHAGQVALLRKALVVKEKQQLAAVGDADPRDRRSPG